MTEIAGTTSIRRGHELNIASLAHYLQENLEAFHGPLVIRQFQGGQSNPTYYCEAASGKYVLRKKPPGKLLRSAHAVDREYRVLRALSGSAVPVPQTRLYCDDDSVIGTPFYLMDFLPGRVFTNPMLPGLQEGERRAMYASMNDALVQLHRFNWQSAGLADFGKPEKYIDVPPERAPGYRRVGLGTGHPRTPAQRSRLQLHDLLFPL